MKTEYQGLPQDEEGTFYPATTSRRVSLLWKGVAAVSLTVNIVFALYTLSGFAATFTRTTKLSSESACLKEISSYSPLLHDVAVQLDETTINGTLFPNSSPPSVWRSPPSPAVDAAWHHLSRTDLFAITKSDAVSLGRDPEAITAIPASYGFGTDLYLAELDGQHHLHCLNMLRKYAYLPYYFPEYVNTFSMPVFHQNHLTHCIDILRQQLLCTLSTEVITYRWIEGQSIPQPDFSVQKQCKNHAQIGSWLEQKWSELPLSDEQKVHVPKPQDLAEIQVESSPYWDELVRKAKEKGVSVHEYVEQV